MDLNEKIALHAEWVSGESIKGTRLELQDIVLSNQKIPASNLAEAILLGVHFINCDLEDVDFYSGYMPSIKFTQCNLKGVNFTKANLDYAEFLQSDLGDANFFRSSLYEAKFEECHFRKNNFQKSFTKGARGLPDSILR